MANQEAPEIGLVLAELESQLKARETPASPEEAGEMLREIMARRAAEREKLQRPSPEASMSNPERDTFALVEDGTSRVWLFLAGDGSVNRLLDGTWVDDWRTDDEVIMPDELGDFREASDSELSTLLQEAAASSTLSPERASAALQAEQPQPASVKARKPDFSEETMRKVMEQQDRERAYRASLNPKGVPIIFPG